MEQNETHDRQYYEQLLKSAEQESKRRMNQEQEQLLEEDPLGINYARWATEEEMTASLSAIEPDVQEVSSSGVPLFCKEGVVYTDPSDSHSMIIGASGSKKTRLFILPSILNLMKAGESIIVTDPKAELYERTSGALRENGYEVFCINFRDDSRQNCWNPLDAPRNFYREGKFDLAVGLLNDFSTIAVPSNPRNSDPFWDDTARSAFMGMLLLLLLLAEEQEQINIRSLLRMRNTLFQESNHGLFQKLYQMLDPGSIAASYLSALSVAPEKTFGSILATLDTHLIKFIMRPDLTDMLCHDDIDFHAIGHEKTAVFLVMPDEKETYHGLISIFIQQCYESLIFEAQKLPGKTLPRRVNFLLDEFSSLPPIKEFPAMIAAARSRNIRFNIVVQSEKQLRSRYADEAETIKGNCNNWIFLYSRELQTLEEICRLCGNQRSGKPLVTPSRLQRLDKDKGEVLVIHGRNYPFLSTLDDINCYDREEILPTYCAKSEERPIRILKVDELMKKNSEAWLIARLAQDTVKQAEEEEKMQEAQRLQEEKEQEIAAQLQLRASNLLPVSRQNSKNSPLREPAGRCYCTENPPELADLQGYACVRIEEPDQSQEKTAAETEKAPASILLPPGSFPLNYLSVVTEINRTNIGIYSKDEAALELAAHTIYQRSLAGGQVIPIFFHMQEQESRWNAIAGAGDVPQLLPMLLSQRLLGGEIPEIPPEKLEGVTKKEVADLIGTVDETLLASHETLMQEFNRIPEGMPQYLLILHRTDLAYDRCDAIWQSCHLGEMPNVRVVVTTTERGMLTENCVNWSDVKKNKIHASFSSLFFDEETNTVKMRQAPQPELLLEVGKC